MDLKHFIARHCYERSYLGTGVFMHSGYAMDPLRQISLPAGFREMKEWGQGNRRVFVSEKDLSIITQVDHDLTVVKYQDQERFNHEITEQANYYRDAVRQQRRSDAQPYHARVAPCLL